MFKKQTTPDRLGKRIKGVVGADAPRTVGEIIARDSEKPRETLTTHTRKSARQPAFREAQIRRLDNGETVSVMVKEVSADGAKIESFRHLNLPTMVEFYEPLSGRRKKARVVWQEEMRAALQFISQG